LKVIKEQAKQQQWVADKAIMEEWAAQQERHEAARKAQVNVLAGYEPKLPLAQQCHATGSEVQLRLA
jgi:hypothetical protein